MDVAVNKKKKKRRKSFKFSEKADFWITLLSIGLSCIGVLFIGSATITSSSNNVMEVLIAVFKQVAFLLAGILLMNWISNTYQYKFNTKFINMFRASTMTFACIVTVGLVVCLFSSSINGANAWISINLPVIGAITIQPAEFAKLSTILLIASYCCGTSVKEPSFGVMFMPLGLIVVQLFIIILLQNDLGSGVVVAMIMGGCLLIPRNIHLKPVKRVLIVGIVLVVCVVLFLLTPNGIKMLETFGIPDYMIGRFRVAMDPFYDMHGEGFHVSNSLIAFTRGGIFGVGIGNGIQKLGYLPFAASDFIIAVIAEETGFIGLTIVFSATIAIMYRLVSYALKVEYLANKVVLFGTAMYLFVHFVFNVGGATAMLPFTGVPILMLSSGGSSLLAWFMCLGFSQAIIAKKRRGEQV